MVQQGETLQGNVRGLCLILKNSNQNPQGSKLIRRLSNLLSLIPDRLVRYQIDCNLSFLQSFSSDKVELFAQDHIAEVFEKWDNIEDEIWAKVIILERNRRVAKAYARAPILTINGSEDGFDGFKIGVNGFDNPLRDYKVKEFKAQIGAGCKLKMGDNGDILVKRVGKGNIYIKNILEETAVSNEILKLPHGLLELDRALKLFDMKKFKQNMNREMKRQYPDRSKIETQVTPPKM